MHRSWRWLVRALTCSCLAVPALVGQHLPVANAVEPGSLSAQISSSWQANATVWRMADAHGDIWMVGDFTSLRPPGDALGTGEHPAEYFAALHAATGALDPNIDDTHTFAGQPSGSLPLTDGAVAASPDGNTIYVGGSFTSVDGQPRSHVAAFSASTGALLPWQVSVTGKVVAIATSGSTVYLGGKFSKVDGSDRSNLAAVSATDGSLVAWGSTQPGTDLEVHALAVTPDGGQVVAGGYFTQVDGLAHSADGSTPYNKAVVIGGVGSDAAGVLEPLAADVAVPPNVGTLNTPGSCFSDVKDVVISNGVAYFANEGTGLHCFDGTWAANLSSGSLTWVNHCLGATQTLAVIGNYLYKGSHVHDCQTSNPNGDPNNFPQVPTGHNRHVTSESLSNGFLGPWYPNMNGGANFGPRAMATDGSQLYVGGDFTVINGIHQQGITRFTETTDYATPKPAAPTVTSTKTGVATVTAVAPVDLDDPSLVLQLFENGGKSPIETANVTSLFWRQPTVKWVVRGLPGSTKVMFTVRAVERYGTGHSPMSGSSHVTVACARSTPVRAALQKVTIKRVGAHSRRVRIEVCSAGAVHARFELRRNGRVLARKLVHYTGAGNRSPTLAVKNSVSRGSVRAFVYFSKASHHLVADRKVYLPR